MIGKKTVSKVLEIKEHTREQLEAEVKAARQKLDLEQAKLEGFEKIHQDTCAEFTGRQMNDTLPVREMELYYTYLKHLAKQIDQQRKIVVIRSQEVDARHQAVIEAYQEHRLVEILRDKLVHRESREAGRVEQKETDYTFLTRRAGR